MKGYRLHDERISYSGGIGSMRSVKYELVDTLKTAGLRDKVAQAIAHDYRSLYGPLNFEEYLKDNSSPSLMDFWLKALSLGFVFSNQNSIESEFLRYKGRLSVLDRCYQELSDDVRGAVDELSFQQFLLKSHRGVEKKSDENRQKIVLNLAKKGSDISVLSRIAKDWSDNFNISKNQLEFKCQIFDVSMPEMPERRMSLSFAIDTEFTPVQITNKTEFMDMIIGYYQQKVGAEQAKKFLAIGDNGNYFNGLFGGLLALLREGKVSEVSEFLYEVYELGSKEELRRRLLDLKTLADKLDEPKLVDKWSDYRIDFNGTIESWYSNREVKQQMTVEQLDGITDKKTGEMSGGLIELLEELKELLPEDSEIRDGILFETGEFLKTRGRLITREFTNELDSYLSTMRSDLNEWSQSHKESKLPQDWQRKLSKHIQSSPLFFGENKVQLWQQLVGLKASVRTDIDKLIEVMSGSYEDYEITDKQIDVLAQLYNRIKSDGNKLVVDRLRAIEKELKLDFQERTELDRYYISGYERAKVKQLGIPFRISVKQLGELSGLNTLYGIAKKEPQINNILRDVVQLSKVILSALVHGSALEREVSFYHSNLSGYANLISRNTFVSRATIQSANGSQVRLAVKDSKYWYAFNRRKFIERDEAVQFSKTYNFSLEDFGDEPLEAPYLEVRSSYYQIQFLDWFMGNHKKKKTGLGAGGAFSISEKTIEIDWSGETPVINKESDRRVFVSQPFEIKPLSGGRQVSGNRFIGIDIGEYGLAYCLVEISGNKVKVGETGFIEDQQQRKLKYAVKSLRDNQVRSTFNTPNTLVARIRESLIGSYRNQLEALAMRLDARLSFEFEVSNFETGSNRISKVYSSIKRSSIKRRDNNSENKMSWGDRGQMNWGLETTAAGTSQTCSKCRRWSSLAIKDSEFYDLSSYDDKLLKTKIGDGEVCLLSKKDMGPSIKGKDLKGLVYKSMRPNEDGLGMEIVKRQFDWDRLSESFGANKPRGNIGIFVCPYIDCLHISDADIQAALNIAIRGYLKFISEGKVKTAEEFTIKSATLEFCEMPLILQY